MSHLASILASPTGLRPHQPLVICQSSLSQTSLPVLRRLIKPTKPPPCTLLFCFLYPASSLISDASVPGASFEVFDYTERIPGYESWVDSRQDILAAVESGKGQLNARTVLTCASAPPGSLTVVIDSVDTFASDIGSDSQTFTFIKNIFRLVTSRPRMSQVCVHKCAIF